MQSDAVIEDLDVVEDSGASLSEGGKAVVVDEFIFEAAPEGDGQALISLRVCCASY